VTDNLHPKLKLLQDHQQHLYFRSSSGNCQLHAYQHGS